jgi:hypothetical protein
MYFVKKLLFVAMFLLTNLSVAQPDITKLRKIAYNFKPVSKELRFNINDIDSLIFQKVLGFPDQEEVNKLFILILLKQYYFHLRCCNQSYNLHDMRIGSAGIIINRYYEIASVKIWDNFLSSDEPYYWIIKNNKKYYNNRKIKKMIRLINKEQKRIENGI